MEGVATISNIEEKSNGDLYVTMKRNPNVPYRLWKEAMDKLERQIKEMEREVFHEKSYC